MPEFKEYKIPVNIDMAAELYLRDYNKDEKIDTREVMLRICKLLGKASELDGDFNILNIDVNFSNKTDKTPFGVVCECLEELYNRKNHDYGNSFDEQLDEDGLLVAKIRLMDKLKRFEKLIKSDAQVDESIKDTVIDLACYSIMTLMWMAKHTTE